MTLDPYVDPDSGILRNRLGIAFVDRFTHYFAEVNAIHPFREGNGRTQRAFFRQLGDRAGWPIDWSGLEQAPLAHASMASRRGDNGPLRTLLDTMVAS